MEEFKVLDETNISGLKELMENDNMVFDTEILNEFVKISGAYGFIYLVKQKPIGLAYGCRLARPDGKKEMYLHSIDILPEYQNKGYGTTFLQSILDYARDNGFGNLFLCSSKGLQNACHIYEKCGGKRDCEDEIIFSYLFDENDR